MDKSRNSVIPKHECDEEDDDGEDEDEYNERPNKVNVHVESTPLSLAHDSPFAAETETSVINNVERYCSLFAQIAHIYRSCMDSHFRSTVPCSSFL